jgi:carbamate kinase
MRLVIALGGNALLHLGEHPDAHALQRRIADLGPFLRQLATEHEVILTYGSASQVGMLAEESEADAALEAAYPFDALEAQTQGLLGYWLARELDQPAGPRPPVAVITRVLVNPADRSFGSATKFIGPIYSEEEAKRLSAEHGWQLAKDHLWWRRVVPSPPPVEIVELSALADLLIGGNTIVCCGGGGVPVMRDEDGRMTGVLAVVDKDLTASLLATRLRADALLLLTDVDAVYTDYDSPHATAIREVDSAELRAMDFRFGSMGLKVQAACDFVEATGGVAAIGAAHLMLQVLAGTSGTIVRSAASRAGAQEAAEEVAWNVAG